MEQHLGNATSITSSHRLRDVWKSPRGTVLRIEALAVVAIIVSFFLAAFGSCRRWSNRWIVQKGFFAAHALSLSLGIYSIGLMQSSSVKSEMYPIWTVSLFALFGCIDPVTAYNGLDYKGPLSKMVYEICLQCGYVLLLSISTISSDVGNTAIIMLSAITFIKGFHRSLALVQQSRMRDMVQSLQNDHGETSVLRNDPTINDKIRGDMKVDFSTGIVGVAPDVLMRHIDKVLKVNKVRSCYDVCVAFCLSHKLHQHFLGLGYRMPRPETVKGIDYKWALKVIEIELAFVYDVFFTGNPFLHYYQAKTTSLWALASFTGICFVGVAAAVPGTMASRHTTSGIGGSIYVVDTTTADLVITFVILASLALLQLTQLIRCWTSNWARLAVACAYARSRDKEMSLSYYETPYWRHCWMRLKAFVATSTNWFDRYLWQDKIGQYSIVSEGRFKKLLAQGISSDGKEDEEGEPGSLSRCLHDMGDRIIWGGAGLFRMLGLDYVGLVLLDLLGIDTSKRSAVRLDEDVKASVIDFLGQIETDRLDENWLSFSKSHEAIKPFLPYFHDPQFKSESHGYRYAESVMIWHIATWYCELAEQEEEKRNALSKPEETAPGTASYLKKAAAAIACCFKEAGGGGGGGRRREVTRNRRVANALSNYCAYLVMSVPELLPGPASETMRAYSTYCTSVWVLGKRDRDRLLGGLSDPRVWTALCKPSNIRYSHQEFYGGVSLAKLLFGDNDPPLLADANRRSDIWKTLAHAWVRLLTYAAPYGNVEAHMRHLSHGGEFITHLWALLYHLDIREWKLPGNLHSITTINHAERILNENGLAVVAFLHSLSGFHSDELAIASRLEDGVRFYQTSIPDIAKRFYITPVARKYPPIVLVNKEKLTFYDGEFRAYDIARFVTTNKLALANKARTHKSTPSTFDNPINKQSLQDEGHTEDGTQEEIILLS